MGDNPLDMITNVGANLFTGGLYSIGKSALSDDPLKSFTAQGFDMGLSSTFNQGLVDTFGPEAGMAFNAAGGAAGAAGGLLSMGAEGAAAGAEGAAPAIESGVTPLATGAAAPIAEGAPLTGAAALTEGGPVTATGMPTELAPGVLNSTSPADMAGAQLTGDVGPAAADAPIATPDVSATTPGSVAEGSPTVPGTPTAPSVPGTGVPPAASNITPKDYASLTGSVERMKAGADVATEVAGWSPTVKAALTMGGVMAGGQMITGAMGGLFQGLSAQKQLQLEQLINQQNQAQRQYLNKNNAYAPNLAFKQPGVLATPK